MASKNHHVPSHPKLDPRHPNHQPHRPAYTTIICGREFAMSDQLMTVISGMYGPEAAKHAHFTVNDKPVPHHSLLDDHQGEVLHIRYALPEVDPEWITSLQVPKGFAV